MSVLKPKDFESEPKDFESAEPRKKGRQGQKGNYSKSSQLNSKRKYRKDRPKPTRRKAHASLYKKLYEKVRKIPESSSFEEWLAELTGSNLSGSEALQVHQYAEEYHRKYKMPVRITLPTAGLIIAYILSNIPGAAADVGKDVMAEMCREDGIGCVQESNDTPSALPNAALPNAPTIRTSRKRPTGSSKRRAKSDKRKERLKKALVELSIVRETRLPVSGLELWTEGKWLQYMVGTLADDNQHFEKEMATVQRILTEVYELVDNPLDGAGDGNVKREYMQPILSPVIYDLAVNALRADWAFVNATFHKKIYEDSVSKKMQRQRTNKIVARLAQEADVEIEQSVVVNQLIQHVDDNPESWYNKKVPSLTGTNMVKFLRSTTKSYVRKALAKITEDNEIPEDNEQAIKYALHVAAVIDASLSGKAINKRASETASVSALEGALHNANPKSVQIVEHYKRFLREQQTERRRHAINALLVETMDNNRKLVRDVRLLWSIYDEDSENAFSKSEHERYTGIADRVLGKILKPYRERDAKNRGHSDGMEFLNNLLHEWANKLLVGIFVVVAGIGKLGCPRCRKGCSGKAGSTKAKKKESKDKIKSMQVYTIGRSDKLWIREKNMYKRISNRGHSDYFTRIQKQKSVSRTQAQLAGEIDADGNYRQ
jgi:hypothetical protein